MRPDEYEKLVALHFEQLGYDTSVTQQSNDYGVDVFASLGDQKVAIQVKMYGATSRKINRQMIMELHGAKDYFDCCKAVMATDGELLPTAQQVAGKLGVEVLKISSEKAVGIADEEPSNTLTFEDCWERYVIPLAGQTLVRKNGGTNIITKVDWSGIERMTSSNRPQKIKIEIFKNTINHLLEHGTITREYINQEYVGRASSGVILILSNTPLFDLTNRPTGLKLNSALVESAPVG